MAIVSIHRTTGRNGQIGDRDLVRATEEWHVICDTNNETLYTFLNASTAGAAGLPVRGSYLTAPGGTDVNKEVRAFDINVSQVPKEPRHWKYTVQYVPARSKIWGDASGDTGSPENQGIKYQFRQVPIQRVVTDYYLKEPVLAYRDTVDYASDQDLLSGPAVPGITYIDLNYEPWPSIGGYDPTDPAHYDIRIVQAQPYNSAKVPFDPGPVREETEGIWTINRYCPDISYPSPPTGDFSPPIIGRELLDYAWQDKTNMFIWKDYNPYFLKLNVSGDLEVDVSGSAIWKMTFVIRYRVNNTYGWKGKYLDAGWMDKNKKNFTDLRGQPVNKPQPLDGSGMKLATGSNAFVYRSFMEYEPIDFEVLKLPMPARTP